MHISFTHRTVTEGTAYTSLHRYSVLKRCTMNLKQDICYFIVDVARRPVGCLGVWNLPRKLRHPKAFRKENWISDSVKHISVKE